MMCYDVTRKMQFIYKKGNKYSTTINLLEFFKIECTNYLFMK